MRYNDFGQVARDDAGAAVAAWLDNTTEIYQRPVDPAKPNGAWMMVTRKAGAVTPVSGFVNGCNQLAAGGGRWMRRFDGNTPKVDGSHAWTPSDGYVGDIDGGIGLTISADGLTLTPWLNGQAVAPISRIAPFGGVRIKSGVASWVEFPGPTVKAVDIATCKVITVAQMGPQAYAPVVFWHGTGYWAVYQTDDMGGLCHPVDDASQGYRFAVPPSGTTPSIYDPDVWIHSDGLGVTLGWSKDPGQMTQGELVIPVLGESMVPLALPAPVPATPIGPTSPPLPEGTWMDLAPYFAYDGRCWPRGNKAKGDTHGMDMQLVQHQGAECLWFDKFDTDGRGRLGELLRVAANGDVHLLSDCSNRDNHAHPDGPFIDTWDATLWLRGRMQIGRAHGVRADGLIRKHREDGRLFAAFDFAKEMWISRAWPAYHCGPDLGVRPVVEFVYNNTGVQEGQTTDNAGLGVERYRYALGAGWVSWDYTAAPKVFGTGRAVWPSQPDAQSDFYHRGGQRFPPNIPAWIPLGTIAPTPPTGGTVPNVPDHSAVVEALYETGAFSLATKTSCGIFTDAAARALHSVDPNFGHVVKRPGQNQYPDQNGHAVDAVLYRSDAPGQSTAIDLIRAVPDDDETAPGEAPGLNWGEDIPRYSVSDWRDPGPQPKGLARPAIPFPVLGMTAFDWCTHRNPAWLDLHLEYGLPFLRLVVQSVWRTRRELAEGIDQLDLALPLIAAKGLGALVCIHCDTKEYGMSREDVIANTIAVNAVMVRHLPLFRPFYMLGELGNENQNGNEQPFMMDPHFLKENDALVDTRIPLSWGTMFGTGVSAAATGGSWTAHHSDRGLSPDQNGQIMAAAQVKYGVSVIDREPLGFAEPGTPGQRTWDVEYARGLGKAAKQYGLGGLIYHTQAGLRANVSEFGPSHRAGAVALVEGFGGSVVTPPVPPAEVDALIALRNKAIASAIEIAYATLLSRKPDPVGLGLYSQRLRSEGWTVEQMEADIKSSAEYKSAALHPVVGQFDS